MDLLRETLVAQNENYKCVVYSADEYAIVNRKTGVREQTVNVLAAALKLTADMNDMLIHWSPKQLEYNPEIATNVVDDFIRVMKADEGKPDA